MKKYIVSILVASMFLIGTPFVVSKVSAADMSIRDFIQLLIAIGVIPPDRVALVNIYLTHLESIGTTTPPVIATTTPTATIMVNGTKDLTLHAGQSYTYTWSSTNGVSASSNYYSNDPVKCRVSNAWYVNTLNGSVTMNNIIQSYQGCVWTVNFVVKNSAGVTATDSVILRFPGPDTSSSITVISPNGGESWLKETGQTISWQDNRPFPTSCSSSANSAVAPTCVGYPRYYDIYLNEVCVIESSSQSCTTNNQRYLLASKVSAPKYNWLVDKQVGAYTVSVCDYGTNQCDTSDRNFNIVSSPTVPVMVNLIDNSTVGGNGDAFIDLSILGNSSNTQVDHWVLKYNCFTGVTLDNGKGAYICDGISSGERMVTYYAYNIYNVTSDYKMWTVNAQNNNNSSVQLNFSLIAYGANNNILGSDRDALTLSAHASTPQPSQPTIVSLGTSNALPGERVAIYVSGVPQGLPASQYGVSLNSVLNGAVLPATWSSDGSYLSFIVPNIPAGRYDLSVSYGTGALTGTNDVPFTINTPPTPPPVVVPAPTATLMVNGTKDFTGTVGQAYTYTWGSTNGVSASSNYNSNYPLTCGAGGVSRINTLGGSLTENNLVAGYRGCIWTVNYVVTGSDGRTATDSVIIRLPALTSSTGSQSYATAAVGFDTFLKLVQALR